MGKYKEANSYFDVSFELLADLHKVQEQLCEKLLSGGLSLKDPQPKPYSPSLKKSYHLIDLERIQHHVVNEDYDLK